MARYKNRKQNSPIQIGEWLIWFAILNYCNRLRFVYLQIGIDSSKFKPRLIRIANWQIADRECYYS